MSLDNVRDISITLCMAIGTLYFGTRWAFEFLLWTNAQRQENLMRKLIDSASFQRESERHFKDEIN